jgi:hypothetical protein
MFDPTIARFTSEDPMGFDAGDPNLYRYTGNDPTNATDPSGMEPLGEYALMLMSKIQLLQDPTHAATQDGYYANLTGADPNDFYRVWYTDPLTGKPVAAKSRWLFGIEGTSGIWWPSGVKGGPTKELPMYVRPDQMKWPPPEYSGWTVIDPSEWDWNQIKEEQHELSALRDIKTQLLTDAQKARLNELLTREDRWKRDLRIVGLSENQLPKEAMPLYFTYTTKNADVSTITMNLRVYFKKL